MTHTYTFTYENNNSPKWEKVFTAENGEVFSVALVFENEEDRLQLSAEQVYVHMGNMLQYVKDRTNALQLIQLSDEPPNTYWPFHGNYDQVESTLQEIQKWWSWAYYNDNFDTDPE